MKFLGYTLIIATLFACGPKVSYVGDELTAAGRQAFIEAAAPGCMDDNRKTINDSKNKLVSSFTRLRNEFTRLRSPQIKEYPGFILDKTVTVKKGENEGDPKTGEFQYYIVDYTPDGNSFYYILLNVNGDDLEPKIVDQGKKTVSNSAINPSNGNPEPQIINSDIHDFYYLIRREYCAFKTSGLGINDDGDDDLLTFSTTNKSTSGKSKTTKKTYKVNLEYPFLFSKFPVSEEVSTTKSNDEIEVVTTSYAVEYNDDLDRTDLKIRSDQDMVEAICKKYQQITCDGITEIQQFKNLIDSGQAE